MRMVPQSSFSTWGTRTLLLLPTNELEGPGVQFVSEIPPCIVYMLTSSCSTVEINEELLSFLWKSKEYVSLQILHIKFFSIDKWESPSLQLDAGYTPEVKAVRRLVLKQNFSLKHLLRRHRKMHLRVRGSFSYHRKAFQDPGAEI